MPEAPRRSGAHGTDGDERVETLVRRLAETEAALEALISGQVDAVASPLTAAPILLQDAQDALRRSEERYRAIIAESPAIVAELGPDASVSFINDRIAQLLGHAPSSLAGRNLWDALVPTEHRADAEAAWRRMRDGTTTEMELPVCRADGERRIFAWNASRRHSSDGTLEGVIVFGLDITQRKHEQESAHRLATEQARRTAAELAERRAELLAEASRILGSSLDHELTLSNVASLVVPAFGDWCTVDLRTESGEVRRVAVQHADPEKVRHAEEIRRRYPPPGGVSAAVLRVLETGESLFFPEIASLIAGVAHDEDHLELLRSLGMRSAILVPLRIRERTVGVITLVSAESGRSYEESDVRTAEDLANRAAVAIENARLFKEARTARVEAEAARAEAEAANRAKSEFLANMSHELRTPLNAIAGYVQLLDEGIQGPVNQQQREYLRRVKRSQEHLLGLINGVLNFAKLEAGHVQFNVTDMPLRDLLAEVDDLIAPQVRANGIEYENHVCDNRFVARADRDKTRQIVLNLLSNAVKFTPRGGRIVIDCDVEDDRIVVHVRDSGIGIPPDKIDAIFDPFVQVGKLANREGTGLGLAISRDLARAMHGDLTATSEPGAGSTFTLRLPLPAASTPAAASPQVAHRLGDVVVPRRVLRDERVGAPPSPGG